MPKTPAGLSSINLLFILGAFCLPIVGVVIYQHPVLGEKIRSNTEEFFASETFTSEDGTFAQIKSKCVEFQGQFLELINVQILGKEPSPPVSASVANADETATESISERSEQSPQLASRDGRTKLITTEVDSEELEVSTGSAPTRPPILMTVTETERVFGMPIARFLDESWILRNDGFIVRVPLDEVVEEVVLEKPFLSIPINQLVADLRKEFGLDYEIRSEQPYVWVTRRGVSQFWNERFRLLHISIRQFCSQRGIDIRNLDFPLVAVILRSEAEFYQYCRSQNIDVKENLLGIYSPTSNRIILYEDPEKLSRQDVIETICHEATHQLANNLGLQQRCADSPLWLTEGLATLFEAPAYAQPNSAGRSPWPKHRRITWHELLQDPARLGKTVDSLVRNDNMFEKDPDAAYAVAWGLTHYFANKHSKEFNAYLHQTSRLPPFIDFDSNARWEHFRTFFGSDIGKLTIALRNHISSL